ncbi:MAG: Helicase associated domain protein [Candidatus Faecivicinus sp.]
MKAELYPHNQKAYDAAVQLLKETGRAAVVHPTGTGKSFIAFHLAKAHPQAQFLWLSPSHYIFRTQQEAYARAVGLPAPENICFYTYASLSMMDAQTLEELRADCIVLDEFHRCGAKEWNRGVEALLEQFPEAPVLGLSATHIRYLDNQRDMADELFDGCIASEMTLGEAIGRGILPAPKYVISLYSCQEELERYRRRIQRARGAVQQAAEKYLEALRRALDRAEGLNVIFQRHMTDPRGKYLVFCANREHLQEMLKKVPEWFSGVDPEPHVYAVYAESPESREEFERFTADESDHLKLLYCINMLNEGIHVKGVRGVILLRPTVSPIVYKQQIGRALSASDGETPVIFDVVNNFDNLYSISAVERELQEAVTFCRNGRCEEEIVRESFEIIDEVRACRQLFEQLEEALTFSWEQMYRQAEMYYREHGDLDVPKRYATEEGLPLGSWLTTQRKVKRGLCNGRLTQEQIERLDKIGMIWENRLELRWERGFAEAKAYYEAHGNLDVPTGYATAEGFPLGGWISNQRQLRGGLNRRSRLSPERIDRLDGIGMIWCHADYAFERNYLAAMEYQLQHGNLKVPSDHVCADGFQLGAWINRLRDRRAGRNGLQPLTQEQIDRLDAIGMVWRNKFEDQWERAFAEAQRWYDVHGNLDVPAAYAANGIRLRRWLTRQREAQQSGKLSAERCARLKRIGMTWLPEDAWERSFLEAERYYREHGDLEVPADYVDANGSWLGKWISLQRRACREGKLTAAQTQRLSAIGMRWISAKELQWDRMYECAAAYAQAHKGLKDLDKDEGQPQLRLWYQRQKRKRRNGGLSHVQAERLDALGG